MKIYNEIVIDMNPESLSYGETLHEDSFEHAGDLMLMQEVGDIVTTKGGYAFKGQLKDKYSGAIEDYNSSTDPGAESKYFLKLSDDKWIAEGQISKTYPEFKFSDAGIWEETGNFSSLTPEYDTKADLQATSGDFTYSVDETGSMTFDPTSPEFQESVEGTGGYGELLEGFGMTDYQQYFDDPNLDELGFLGEEQLLLEKKYGEGRFGLGTEHKKLDLERRGLDLERDALTEAKRAGETSYSIGRRQAGLRAGESLFDIKRQTEGAAASTGFAGAGAVAATGRRAQRGIMADYKLQQEELASGLKGVQSAYDIGTKAADITGEGIDIADTEIGMAKTQGGIDYKRSLSQFWDTMEDKFYSELTNVEGIKQD